VATLKENGVDLNAEAWYGMWLPAGSSPDFAKKLSIAVAEVLAKPEVKEKAARGDAGPGRLDAGGIGAKAGRQHGVLASRS